MSWNSTTSKGHSFDRSIYAEDGEQQRQQQQHQQQEQQHVWQAEGQARGSLATGTGSLATLSTSTAAADSTGAAAAGHPGSWQYRCCCSWTPQQLAVQVLLQLDTPAAGSTGAAAAGNPSSWQYRCCSRVPRGTLEGPAAAAGHSGDSSCRRHCCGSQSSELQQGSSCRRLTV